MVIQHLFLSPGHSYFGHHGGPSVDHPIQKVDEIECVAGRGIRGDRFFDYKPDYKGQITFFAWEVLEALWEKFGTPPRERNPAATRRNVVTEGIDLNGMIGKEFEIQGIWFRGSEECRPCYWMNEAFRNPEAEAWLKGRGGLRARILTNGILRVDTQ